MTRLHDAIDQPTRRRLAIGVALVAAIAVVVVLAVWVIPSDDDSQVGTPADEAGTVDPPSDDPATVPTEPGHPAPPTDGDPDPSDPAASDEAGEVTVEVHLTPPDAPNCGDVTPVERTVTGPEVLRGALDELVAGPTEAEEAEGLTSWFSADTAGVVRSVAVANGTARVDFENFADRLAGASTSCGSAILLAQLDRTALQFATVGRVIYSFDGDIAAFYEWLQGIPPEERPRWGGEVEVDMETGAVSAAGFNDHVEAEAPIWAFEPREAAVVLLDLARLTVEGDQRTEVVESPGRDGRVVVTVTTAALADDSTEAVRHTITFDAPEEGPVRFVEGTWGVRCQPGRGHQDFQASPCT